MSIYSAFGGETYSPKLDHSRLTGQLERVFDLMSDGKWRTLREIAELAGGSEAGVSARLRDLRKAQYGGFSVARSLDRDSGIWRYRLSVGA